MRKITIVTLALISTLLAYTVGIVAFQNIIEIKWNATGVYEKIYPISVATIPGAVLRVTYDYSHYHVATASTILPPGSILVASSSGLYLIKQASSSSYVTVRIYPKICVVINNSNPICNWGSTVKTVTVSPYLSPVPVVEWINTCLVVAYQPIMNESPPTISFELYDFYTQKLITSATWSANSSLEICGVPNIVLINITVNGKWLGMFYITTRPPTATFPPQLYPIAFLFPLALFLALAVRNRLKEAGVGAIIFGVMLIPFISAMHLTGLGYLGSLGYLISGLSIILGVVLIWLGGRQATW